MSSEAFSRPYISQYKEKLSKYNIIKERYEKNLQHTELLKNKTT